MALRLIYQVFINLLGWIALAPGPTPSRTSRSSCCATSSPYFNGARHAR
jgi:hypothetical protein